MARNTAGLRRGGPGRPKGVPNKATQEAREVCAAMVDDPVYRQKLKSDFQRRKVHPAVEQMIWHYAKGKPKDTLAIENAPPVLVVDELLAEDIADLKRGREG